MASLITYSKLQLIQRVRQHMANNFPDAAFSTSENEVLLYIDQALAFGLIGSVYAGAKVEGNLVMPEAYLTTYLLPSLSQDSITGEWYTTLPQPPVSLPLGYSITGGYFANSANGRGKSVFWIKNHRVAYREDMPMPFGVRAWVEGVTVKLKASDGGSLLNQPFYVTMASTRTSSLTDVMTLPDDAIEQIFNNVVAKLKDRLQLPKDIVQDDISAGNKSS
jgi:hypothetical protein